MRLLSRLPWSDVFLVAVLYTSVLLYQGYQYGQGDQSQILPCLYAQDNPPALTNDFYVDSYLDSPLNERTIFHFLFRFLGYHQPWIVFIWHALLSITLIYGWVRIAALGIHQPFYQFLAVFLILIPGYHTSVGSNELYYNLVIPSLAAKALSTWGIYYYLKERYRLWIYTLIIAGFLQPLVGLQVFLFTGLALVIQQARVKKLKAVPWKTMGLFVLIQAPWVWLLSRYNGGHDDPAGFMDIMEFRLSHHFFPSSFSWPHVTLFVLMAILTMRFYKQRLKWMMIVIVLGCGIYTLGVETYRMPAILYTQWWKTTIWLEAFAFVAVAASLERWNILKGRWLKFQWIYPVLFLLAIGFYRWPVIREMKLPYMFPWSRHISDEVDISLQAGQLTPEDAVFIVPVEFTAFRWYAKRSLFVDYKSMLHEETFLQEWYTRIQRIYAYSLTEKKAGFDLEVFSRTLLHDPGSISLDDWKRLGITHIVSPNRDLLNLKKIASNDTYAVYALK